MVEAQRAALEAAADERGFLRRQELLEPVFRFGALSTERKGRLGGNLCGPIALYNVLAALGEHPDFGEIVHEARSAALLFGLWGTHPWGLARLLRRHGCTVRIVFGKGRIERAARETRVSILTYVRRRLPPTGHNVAVLREERPGGGFVFLNGAVPEGVHVRDAADAPILAACLITVKKHGE